jgi:hypothetical protein
LTLPLLPTETFILLDLGASQGPSPWL